MLSLYKTSNVYTILKLLIFLYILYRFGFIFSLIAYVSGYFTLQFIVKVLFKWEAVGLNDLTFIDTDISNDFVSIGGFYLDKIRPQGIKEKIIERGVKKISKMKQVPFPLLNNWYFYELPLDIALHKANQNIKLISDKKLKNPKELNAYCLKEMKKLFPKENELLWEIHLIDFEDEDGGAMLLKMDHLLTDATGLMNIYSLLIDNFEAMNYPAFGNTKTIMDDIKFWVKTPYLVLEFAYNCIISIFNIIVTIMRAW